MRISWSVPNTTVFTSSIFVNQKGPFIVNCIAHTCITFRVYGFELLFLLCCCFFSFHQFMSTPANGDTVADAHNYDASRLLCTSNKCDITVHDLLPNKKLDGSDMISLGQGYNTTNYPRFAGKEDELIVYSKENQLFIWQLPSPGGRGHRTIDSPLLKLEGHQHTITTSPCFNKSIGTLASGDANGVIKLWVPKETN